MVVKELWNLLLRVEFGRWELCSELIGFPACLSERDVGQQHFEGRQFAVVKTLEYVVTKLFLVW